MTAVSADHLALDAVRFGVALADPESWDLVYENARFAEWLPARDGGVVDGSDLGSRIAGLDVERARDRVSRGRAFRHELEVKKGARPLSLEVEVRAETLDFVLPPRDGTVLKDRFRRALLGPDA